MYYFDTLNDKEFEELANDIVEAIFSIRVERFKQGADQGIDGRFYISDDEKVIVQSKHYQKSGVSKLLNHCKKSEYIKVNDLNPKNYVFVTSVSLSPKNKDNLVEIFQPYLKVSNIIGFDELVSVLNSNPDLVRTHYKLWVNNSNALFNAINNDVYVNNKWLIDDIKSKIGLYVRTQNHDNIYNAIEKNNYIIVTGEPGIGKTTISKSICLDYLVEGYELVNVTSSIKEAMKVYKEGKRQIFYYDDFLGSNFLEYIEGKEDSDIVNFINAVKKDNTKKFILTSRTNIFNQGVYISNNFRVRKIDKGSVVNVKSYTKLEKAKILYNHLYFSDLDLSNIEMVFEKEKYYSIIIHNNFNPRLIEFITDSERLVDGIDYLSFVDSVLTDPSDIWSYVFDCQINRLDRVFVYIVCLSGKNIGEDAIKSKCEEYFRESNWVFDDHWFDKSRRTLVGSLLNRIISRGIVRYELFNPSIKDYVIRVLIENLKVLERLSIVTNNPSEIGGLLFHYRNSVDCKCFYSGLIETLIEKSNFKNFHDMFIVAYYNLYASNKHTSAHTYKFLDVIESGEFDFKIVDRVTFVFKYLIEEDISQLDWNKYLEIILDKCCDIESMTEFSAIIYYLDENKFELDADLLEAYQERGLDIGHDEIHNYVNSELSSFDDIHCEIDRLVDNFIELFEYPLEVSSVELLSSVDKSSIMADMMYDEQDSSTSSEVTERGDRGEISDLFTKYW
ncbi:restriction endonuclease [Vibrio pelagius]|uniref:nSTAND3 domain-containing NTPase n=1 Tax=Vibrio pelagius TaxID=28169 RepID=UPI00354E524D